MTEPERDADPMEVIAAVGHELRSPLATIKGFTSLLLGRWDEIADADKRDMIAAVRDDADRVARMITELLDASRLQTGRLSVSRAEVDVAAVARAVVTRVAVVEPDLEAEVAVDQGSPTAWADPDRVAQVLTNLVENAARHGDPRGIRVHVAPDPDGGGVRVAVHDRGRGIPAADLPRVFDRHFRHEEGRATGTGLGLWITRGLVEALGGQVTATSVEGEGSTFAFTLPPRP